MGGTSLPFFPKQEILSALVYYGRGRHLQFFCENPLVSIDSTNPRFRSVTCIRNSRRRHAPDESSMQEYVPLSESVQDEPADDSAGSPFGPRLRRAVLTLSGAIAAHLWLVHAPVPARLSVPRSAVIAQAGLVGLPRVVRKDASAGDRGPSVRVQTEFVSVGVAGPRYVTVPPDVPVGTTGIVQVRANL